MPLRAIVIIHNLPIGGGCETTVAAAAACCAPLGTFGALGALGSFGLRPLLAPFLGAAAAPLAAAEEAGLSLPLSSVSRKSSGTVEGITGLRLLTLWSCKGKKGWIVALPEIKLREKRYCQCSVLARRITGCTGRRMQWCHEPNMEPGAPSLKRRIGLWQIRCMNLAGLCEMCHNNGVI